MHLQGWTALIAKAWFCDGNSRGFHLPHQNLSRVQRNSAKLRDLYTYPRPRSLDHLPSGPPIASQTCAAHLKFETPLRMPNFARSCTQSEAKALNSHGSENGDEEEAQPKRLFQRRSWSQASPASSSSSSSSASASSSPPGPSAVPAAAGKSSRSSGSRENKRASRYGSSSGTALPPPHAAAAAASAIGSAGVRGRADTRGADDGPATGRPPAAVGRPSRAETPSPPPSAPAGRLADRIRTLRERCCLGLGVEAFEKAYGYLKARRVVKRGAPILSALQSFERTYVVFDKLRLVSCISMSLAVVEQTTFRWIGS